MAVASFTELGRKLELEIGTPIKLTREFVVVLTDNTLEGNPTAETAIIQAIGVDIGSTHPTYTNNRVRKITMEEGFEGSPYHVHVVYEYGPILANELLHPTSRAYVWEADASLGDIAATFFYDGTTKRPLTNSAYDFFPGLTTGEGIATVRVTGNFAQWPTSWFAANNTVNDGVYAGCPMDTLKVSGVRCAQEKEQFGASAVTYWKATAEIQYRESTHNYQLPDVGWNFIDGGQKRRAMVFDFQNSEWVPSPNPIGLNGNGGASPTGWPAILTRRMNVQANFQSLFGNFPSGPLVLA